MKEWAKNILQKKYIIFAITGLVILSVFLGFTVFGYVMVSGDRVIGGVSLFDTDMSGKTKPEVEAFLSKTLFVDDSKTIQFECDGTKFSLTPSQIGLRADIHQTADNIYNIGRNGNIVSRIIEGYSVKFKGRKVTPVYFVDNNKLTESINNSLREKIIPVTEYSVVVNSDSLTVTNGLPGKGLKQSNISDVINKDIVDGKFDGVIKLELTEIEPKKINADEFIKKYTRDAKNAEYSESNGQYIFTPEVNGIAFDEQAAKKIIEENSQSNEPYIIPATITVPEITVKDLQSKFAVDTLSSYSSDYSTSDANRATNVELAASKINGCVINPGEKFSFNSVVGPRTSAHGFKVAQVYEGDRIVNGMGGGICQVSSSLYNAVVLADLKIVSRTNHSMPVSYMPIGRDATVSYGTIDFVFENNKNHPITLSATHQNRVLTVAVKGIDESDGVTVEITTEFISSTVFSTTKVEDASLKPGETKIVKAGANGSVVNSYKIYKKDGRTIKSEHLARSVYVPVTQVVHIGIEQIEPEKDEQPPEQSPEQKEPAPEQTPEQDEQLPEQSEQDTDIDTDTPDEENGDENDIPASSTPEDELKEQLPEPPENEPESEQEEAIEGTIPSEPKEEEPPIYI